MDELSKLFKEIGYRKEDYEEIVNEFGLVNLKRETLIKKVKENYKFLRSLGYMQEEVIKITKQFPSIYGLSIENMKQKIEDIKELGYTQEEVIKMTKTSPSIYSLSIENIKQKIEFYDSINLHSISVKVPSILMQSTKLSYARYQFLKEKGIEIDETNYRNLFIDQKHFEQQYGIKKQELLEKLCL